MFDLTTHEGVKDYLAQTPFPASQVEPLSGGYANYTYRITLCEPYRVPGLSALVNTMVLKHVRPYVAHWEKCAFAIERQEFECLAFKTIPQLATPSPIISLPRLYKEDRVYRAILMEDCGSQCRTLKTVLESGSLSADVARDIGAALGAFIGKLHATTRNPTLGTIAHTTKAAFASNHQPRAMVESFFFYGRILPTLTEDPSPITPPVVLAPEILAKLDVFAKKAEARVSTDNDVLAMGDFRGENFLVVLDPTPRIMIVDWEIARPGHVGMDLGPFLAELYLLRMFYPRSRFCVDIIIAASMSVYREIILREGDRADAEQRLVQSANDTAARVGTYLITVTPRVSGWADPGLRRKAVQEGVEYILRSVDGDEKWLRESIVGGLWGR